MSFLLELESVSSVSYTIPSPFKSSVTSNSGNSCNAVMSSNSYLHEQQSFGGDIQARLPAARSSVTSVCGNSSTTFGGAYTRPSAPYTRSSVTSVCGNSSTTFGGAYTRPSAPYSPVFTRPPWHNSNPFVVVNLNNRIKKCAGCPLPFSDKQGPVYLGVAAKHVDKQVYFDKANSTHRFTYEGVIRATIAKRLVSPPDTHISLLQY
ncbi:unnamed protein product [Porites evermanni]|uniref:Uncharacterized protein n=1 Tax=Porites evermanni TaxID=104178 RepID=A0ABN8R3I0_9CNID|nr:unnamed protein product [Porites evermanni]